MGWYETRKIEIHPTRILSEPEYTRPVFYPHARIDRSTYMSSKLVATEKWDQLHNFEKLDGLVYDIHCCLTNFKVGILPKISEHTSMFTFAFRIVKALQECCSDQTCSPCNWWLKMQLPSLQTYVQLLKMQGSEAHSMN